MRLTIAIILVLCFIGVSATRADPTTQPTAAALVNAVQDSESWIDHVDTFYARFQGTWINTPEEIARRRAKLSLQLPGTKIDEKEFPWLRPAFDQNISYAFDRSRFYRFTAGLRDETVVYDGYHVVRKTIDPDSSVESDSILGSPSSSGEILFYDLSWLRAAKHVFVWGSLQEGTNHIWSGDEHWQITGRQNFHGVDCWVVEGDYGWTRWYVGVAHPLLYGFTEQALVSWNLDELDAATRAVGRQLGIKKMYDGWSRWPDSLPLEHRSAARALITQTVLKFTYPLAEFFLLDYKEISPGKWFPMTQGYTEWDLEAQPAIRSSQRTLHATAIKINQPLPEKLFHIAFAEGAHMYNASRDPPLDYTYKSHFTTPEWQAILNKAATSKKFWDEEKKARDALLRKPAPPFPTDCQWINSETPLSWAQFKGRVVIIDFFAEWCGPCRRDLPTLAQLYDNRKTNGLFILAIHPPGSSRAAIDKVLKEFNLKYPICIDLDAPKNVDAWGRLYGAYAVHGIPCAVVVDDGIVIDQGSLEGVLPTAKYLARPRQ